MEHFYDLPHMGEDWFTYPILYSVMVNRFSTGSHFVEVGSWKGKSSVYMAVEIANSGKNIKFDCVDTWKGTEEEHGTIQEVVDGTLYETFINNISPVKEIINPIRMDSAEAAGLYEDGSLDFVFIDADHSYEGVKRDIIAWLPKVKNGGVLAGHDYGWAPPIRQAVDDVFGVGNYADPWNNGCWITEIKR
jgi:hypothetical protein